LLVGTLAPEEKVVVCGTARVFCRRGVELGWLHFATSRLVCTRCLPDPWAKRDKAGPEAAERIEKLIELEREVDEVPTVF
jgi:hypothetical protein